MLSCPCTGGCRWRRRRMQAHSAAWRGVVGVVLLQVLLQVPVQVQLPVQVPVPVQVAAEQRWRA